MKAYRKLFVLAVAITALTLSTAVDAAETPYAVEWTRQLGTSNDDYCNSVAIDGAGNAFISGQTAGDLDGTNAGGFDAFLTKYDSTGALQWTQQLGTASDDYSFSVAVDSAGNAFISGYTAGDLDGTNVGGIDAFLTKYDSTGALQWTQQLGTSSGDFSLSVDVDAAGNAFISGYTNGSLDGTNAGVADAFLAKYDSAGNLQWTQQLGTSDYDQSHSVAIDTAGNAFISGHTYGDLNGASAGSWDTFLTKFDSAGVLQWTRQHGTSNSDYSHSVAVDGDGNAFISGYTDGSLGGTNEGDDDAFLIKYDPAGNLLWSKQLGTSSEDRAFSVAVDIAGNAFISGQTFGDLGGTNAGSFTRDSFLAKYDSAGNLLWTQLLGTSANDRSWSVAVDAAGNAFISGETFGSMDGVNAGGYDAFLVKFTVPEPATLSLLAMGGVALLKRRRNVVG